jgi:hypothetical protein
MTCEWFVFIAELPSGSVAGYATVGAAASDGSSENAVGDLPKAVASEILIDA